MTATQSEPQAETEDRPRPAGGRAAAWALVAAPLVFVGGWVVAGATVEPYSPRRQAISDLAALDSPRRWFMLAVFVTYGVLMLVGSQAIRHSVIRLAWPAAAINGLAVIAVGAFPIAGPLASDGRHSLAALVAYFSIAAIPVLAAPGLKRTGHGLLAAASALAGVASILVVSSAYGNDAGGLLQRTGTGIGDAWLVVAGLALVAGSPSPVGEP
ncbi:MAG: rane protein [Acidimicrobiales bacterium]|nr:rane protein [Acidimicrobiales bacterium]